MLDSVQPSETAPATRGRIIRWANLYDTVVGLITLGQNRAIREMTVEMANIQPGNTVLDVGCGTGDLTIAAKGRTGSTGIVYGIDAAPEMIEVARHKAARTGLAINFQVDLIEALSFPSGTFDVVLSSLMIHHLPDDLKRQGFAAIRRVLKPDGTLLVIDFKRPTTRRSKFLTALLFHRAVSDGVQDYPAMLQEAGFTQVEAGETKFRLLGVARILGFARGRASS